MKSLPNLLTFLRLALNAPLMIAFLNGHYSYCFWIYLSQEMLDQADGKIAKAFSAETSTGRFFDPFVDSLTHLFGFACFLTLGWLPLWMYLILLFREFLTIFLRLLGSIQGFKGTAQWPGKFKALIHAISLSVAWATLGQLVTMKTYVYPLFLASTLLSLASGAIYIFGYRSVLRKAFT